MSEGQVKTKQRTSTAEARYTMDRLGEPGIANRKAPGCTPWESEHPVNLRLSIPLLFKRYYVTIVAGEERRSPERLAAERRKHPIKTTGNVIILFAAGTVLGFAVFGALQLLAIHLMQERHFLVGM